MLNNVLFILLGAGLVTVGFLAAALAERIRGVRGMKTSERPEEQARRAPRPSMLPTEPAGMPRTPTVMRNLPTRKPPLTVDEPAVTRTPRAPHQTPSPGEDVIAALIAAGYKRTVASEATWACDTAERATIEHWTASALRRCGRGKLS